MKVKIWKISQLNQYIRSLINGDILLNSFFAEGEVSNCKSHSSGHLYFTLKDEQSAMNAVMFKSYADGINFEIRDGMKVIVCGYVDLYEKTGQYQLYVEMLDPLGKGKLYTEFEQLKEKLQKEGVFNQEVKKNIPFYPKGIGVITSKTGAAVRDFIQVAKRRNPAIQIIVYPVTVQGDRAPAEIVSAIKTLNTYRKTDVIVLARGGGSIEDLWAFNNEMVARAIYGSSIPVISAVGHETDYTIADMAADLRAPTPSAAAELAVPDLSSLHVWKDELDKRIRNSLSKNVLSAKNRLEVLQKRKAFTKPVELINQKKDDLDHLLKSLEKGMEYQLEMRKSRLSVLVQALQHLSPIKTMERGFAIVSDMNGQTITKSKQIGLDDDLKIQFEDGAVFAKAIKKE